MRLPFGSVPYNVVAWNVFDGWIPSVFAWARANSGDSGGLVNSDRAYCARLVSCALRLHNTVDGNRIVLAVSVRNGSCEGNRGAGINLGVGWTGSDGSNSRVALNNVERAFANSLKFQVGSWVNSHDSPAGVFRGGNAAYFVVVLVGDFRDGASISWFEDVLYLGSSENSGGCAWRN